MVGGSWYERATDEEIVMRFVHITEARTTSTAGYRSQCRSMRKRLYKILYDGLAARAQRAGGFSIPRKGGRP